MPPEKLVSFILAKTIYPGGQQMPVAKKSAKPGTKKASTLKASDPNKAAKAEAPEAATSSTPSTSPHALGDQVHHPMFGDGTVTAIDGDKRTIEFARGAVKQIVYYYLTPRKP